MITLHAYMASGGSMVIMFCEKPIFPYNKGINFNLTIMVVETSFEKVTPTQ